MRVMVVTHYFPPEVGAPQTRLSELAAAWSQAGDHVTVVTGMPNHPTGVVPPPYRRRWRVRERVEGYRILRTWLFATPNEGLLKKTLGHLSFMFTAGLVGRRVVGPIDVVVVSSPTFFSIAAAWVQAKRHRARFVVEIRDLWPGVFVDLGVLTNRWLIWALERLELLAYRVADHVVVVSEGFKDDLTRRGVPTDKVTTIRNGVDISRFTPGTPDPSMRQRLGAAEGDFLCLYVGAHGISQALQTLVDAAKILGERGVHIAFVGEGAEKASLMEYAGEQQVSNVTFLASVPRDQMAAILAAADVCLVSLRDVPLFSTFIPSKMFEYLAAGRPVIGAIRGEAAQLLADGGGMVVTPENAEELANAIQVLASDDARRAEMAVQGRHYVERHFDRQQLAADYRALLREVAGHRGDGG